jgi:hypothetical protein
MDGNSFWESNSGFHRVGLSFRNSQWTSWRKPFSRNEQWTPWGRILENLIVDSVEQNYSWEGNNGLRGTESFRSHELSPYSTICFEKLTVPELVKKFPTFSKIRRFISLFTVARLNPKRHEPTPHPKILSPFYINFPSKPTASKRSRPFKTETLLSYAACRHPSVLVTSL